MLPLLLFISTALGVSQDCQMEWRKIYAAQYIPELPSYYLKMYYYSGIDVNNLGNFDSCKEIPEAKYVTEYYSGQPLIVRTLCGPKICTAEDYYEGAIPIIPNLLPMGYLVVFPEEYQNHRYRTYDSGAICMLVFIGVVTTIGIAATFADYFLDPESKTSTPAKYLLCFSIITNGKRLLTTRGQERLGKPDSLEMLNAVRVMSIGWVILGHTFLFSADSGVNSNFDTVFSLFKESKYILIYGAFYAVDTFFWLSGLLMAYLFILEVHKTPSFSPWKLGMVYIHRFLRITPVYMFALCFFWSLQIYIGSGPLWVFIDGLLGKCNEYWYTNLIYLNNFIPDWKSSVCLGQSWYLANDMQFFIISPIIILLYIKLHRAIGWFLVFALCCVNISMAAVVAHHFDLSPAILAASNGSEQFDFYYVKPYCRVAPYVLGIACGFIVYTYRKYQDSREVYDSFSLLIAKTQEIWYVRVLTFLLGVSLINILIFSQYNLYKYPGKAAQYDNWSKESNYTFIALERTVYGLGLSLTFLPMLLGHFKLITSFLSLYPWSILARFSFVIYLIHQSIIEILVKSQKTVQIVYEYSVMRDAIYYFILSLFFAIPIVLLIELPSGNIEKLIFSRGIPSKSGEVQKEPFIRSSRELKSVKD